MSAGRPSSAALLQVLLVATVFVLALVRVHDTDAWMHLAVGREIARAGGLPSTEPWTVPILGQPFVYHPWLFALVLYMAYAGGGLAGIVLLKASLLAAAFALLFADALRPWRMPAVATAVLTAVVLAARYRFVERPDIVMLVFLAFTIFALNAYVLEGRRFILGVPAVAALWANSHTSVNLIAVPFVAFLAGGVLQRLIARRGFSPAMTPTWPQLRTIALVFAASLLASLLNPYGSGPWTAGASLLASPWHRQEILELQAPTWHADPWPFAFAAAAALALVLGWRRTAIIHVLMAAPFCALGLSARRFGFLWAAVAGPVIARALSGLLLQTRLAAALQGRAAAALAAAALLTCGGLTELGVEPFGEIVKVPGLGLNAQTVPEQALALMQREGIEGRVLNHFEWGGYVIWRDFPRLRPMLDGRGNIEPHLLESLVMGPQRAEAFDRLDGTYGVDAVLTAYPVGPIVDLGRDPCFAHPGWALVHWDDLALVYLRRGGRYQGVIDRREYRHVKPCNEIPGLAQALADPRAREPAMQELRRNVAETNSSRAWAFLAVILQETGEYDEALAAFANVRHTPGISFLPAKYLGMGSIYLKQGRPREAVAILRRALRVRAHPRILQELAAAHAASGDREAAVEDLRRALTLEDAPPSIHSQLAGLLRELGRETEAAAAEARYRRALTVSEGEASFKEGVRAYMNADLQAAAEQFNRSLMANPANAAAHGNLAFVYYDMGMLDQAFEEHRRALQLDRNAANSHYGLALIHARRGDRALARSHWEQYLALEPRGYYSRRAAEQIQRLGPP